MATNLLDGFEVYARKTAEPKRKVRPDGPGAKVSRLSVTLNKEAAAKFKVKKGAKIALLFNRKTKQVAINLKPADGAATVTVGQNTETGGGPFASARGFIRKFGEEIYKGYYEAEKHDDIILLTPFNADLNTKANAESVEEVEEDEDDVEETEEEEVEETPAPAPVKSVKAKTAKK